MRKKFCSLAWHVSIVAAIGVVLACSKGHGKDDSVDTKDPELPQATNLKSLFLTDASDRVWVVSKRDENTDLVLLKCRANWSEEQACSAEDDKQEISIKSFKTNLVTALKLESTPPSQQTLVDLVIKSNEYISEINQLKPGVTKDERIVAWSETQAILAATRFYLRVDEWLNSSHGFIVDTSLARFAVAVRAAFQNAPDAVPSEAFAKLCNLSSTDSNLDYTFRTLRAAMGVPANDGCGALERKIVTSKNLGLHVGSRIDLRPLASLTALQSLFIYLSGCNAATLSDLDSLTLLPNFSSLDIELHLDDRTDGPPESQRCLVNEWVKKLAAARSAGGFPKLTRLRFYNWGSNAPQTIDFSFMKELNDGQGQRITYLELDFPASSFEGVEELDTSAELRVDASIASDLRPLAPFKNASIKSLQGNKVITMGKCPIDSPNVSLNTECLKKFPR